MAISPSPPASLPTATQLPHTNEPNPNVMSCTPYLLLPHVPKCFKQGCSTASTLQDPIHHCPRKLVRCLEGSCCLAASSLFPS